METFGAVDYLTGTDLLQRLTTNERMIMQIKRVNRKSLEIKPSGRSTDFITPSFGFGCMYQ
jgi:hypothetical protein